MPIAFLKLIEYSNGGTYFQIEDEESGKTVLEIDLSEIDRDKQPALRQFFRQWPTNKLSGTEKSKREQGKPGHFGYSGRMILITPVKNN